MGDKSGEPETTLLKTVCKHQVKNALIQNLQRVKYSFIREHTEITPTEMAKVFGVSRSTINGIRQYRSWKY
jgi:hypothetical protein